MSESFPPDAIEEGWGCSPTLQVERRASVRHTCDSKASLNCTERAGEVRWPARLRSLSADGLYLLVSRRFEPGSLLSVDLQSRNGQSSCTLYVRVVRVAREPSGDWAIGCWLVTKLSASEAETLT